MRAIDWIARTTMLILAALATLALIGSLASVSNSPIGDAFPGQVTTQDTLVPNAPPAPSTAPGETESSEPSDASSTLSAKAAVERMIAQPDAAVARWLKALTYAVIALAAFAAAGVVALVRIGSHLARLADR